MAALLMLAFAGILGLIHMVGLDLNKLDEQQLAWLNADLTAANK